MNLKRFRGLPTDPFISHMRIAYEDGIRNETEQYWRNKIANEVRSFNIPVVHNVDILYAQETLKNKIAEEIERNRNV